LNRRGFTLVELLVGTMVMSVLGVALVRMLMSDSRFVSRQDAMMSARQVARGATNLLAPELRMISGGGLALATPTAVTARIPYAFGMTCGSTGSGTIAATLLPPDSLNYVNASPSGMAWRDDNGTYFAVDGVGVSNSTAFSACASASDSVFVLPGGKLVEISGFGAGGFSVYGSTVSSGSGGTMPPPGQIFYLYQSVTYTFTASVELPGQIALWGQVGFASPVELAAPFDSSAGFRCLVGPDLDPVDCPPAGGLVAVRGLELRFVGASEVTPRGSAGPQTFELFTRVPFLNKGDGDTTPPTGPPMAGG
jgi:prepilin-type N-terminal cleavage/methylation domain-containing protein